LAIYHANREQAAEFLPHLCGALSVCFIAVSLGGGEKERDREKERERDAMVEWKGCRIRSIR
jgi:hypothetical protein